MQALESVVKSSMTDARDAIVLIHGLAVNHLVMWPLAYRLRTAGFAVHSWRYASLFQSIETHADRLFKFLSTDLVNAPRVHIVAHSMGAIVTRAALNRGQVANLGRIVLLAPPNTGSPVARLASSLLGRWVPPTRELSSQPGSYVNLLPLKNDLAIGVISARYDHLVPASNTHVAGELAHQTLPATHSSLLISRAVANKTINFLRTGQFDVATKV